MYGRPLKKADEIYALSSLMPLVGNCYMGAPVILNEMMKAAIAENITGKSFILLNSAKNIYWDKHMHNVKLLNKCFGKSKNNFLTVEYEDNGRILVPLDIKAVKAKLK